MLILEDIELHTYYKDHITLNKVLDACLYLCVVPNVYPCSILNQSDSNCFRETPIVLFCITPYSFIIIALVHILGGWHHHGEIRLTTVLTLHLCSSSTASLHGMSKPLNLCEGEKLQSLLLFIIYYTLIPLFAFLCDKAFPRYGCGVSIK